jgi:hypothetical protein
MRNKHKKHLLAQTKTALGKAHQRPITDGEAQAVLDLLEKLADIQVEILLEEQRRGRLLQESPNGFCYDKPGYCCTICGPPATGRDLWYDKYGLKCHICQDSIGRGEIPPWLGQRRDEWYSSAELEMYFHETPKIIRELIKKGRLIPRNITVDGKKHHLQVFLVEDNETLLPRKDML